MFDYKLLHALRLIHAHIIGVIGVCLYDAQSEILKKSAHHGGEHFVFFYSVSHYSNVLKSYPCSFSHLIASGKA